MRKLALGCFLVLLVGCRTQDNKPSATPALQQKADPELAMSAVLMSPMDDLVIGITLRNISRRALVVQTGVLFGGATYPIAAFSYELVFADGRRIPMNCHSCAPTFIFGAPPTPYELLLEPGQEQELSVAVSQLPTLRDEMEYGSDQLPAKVSGVVIRLRGTYSGPASWTGSVETKLELRGDGASFRPKPISTGSSGPKGGRKNARINWTQGTTNVTS